MKFNHLVKHNGVYYSAGEEVPIEEVGTSKPIVEEKVVPKNEPIIEETKVEEVNDTKKYTKTEINRMSTKELRDLAKSLGIDGDEYVGSELKTMLIEKLV